MTTDNRKNMKYVVSAFILMLLLIAVRVILEKNFFDIIYMFIIIFCLGRYLYIKITE